MKKLVKENLSEGALDSWAENTKEFTPQGRNEQMKQKIRSVKQTYPFLDAIINTVEEYANGSGEHYDSMEEKEFMLYSKLDDILGEFKISRYTYRKH